MKTMMEFYKDLLDFAGMKVSESGSVYILVRDKRVQVTVSNKPLYLPTTEALRDVTDKIIFHPITESDFTEESKVVQVLTKAINGRLNTAACVVGQALLGLAASPEFHKNLTADQSQLVVTLGDVDVTCSNNFIAIIKKSFEKEDSYKLMVNLFIKRGALLNGIKYKRGSIITFPFLENIENDVTYQSIKLRDKDRAVFAKLMKFMFPRYDVQDSYSFGGDSHKAPYLHALYLGALRVVSELNDAILEFKEYIREDDLAICEWNTEWIETMENLEVVSASFKNVPPMQEGNEGLVVKPVQATVQERQPLTLNSMMSMNRPPEVANPASQQRVAGKGMTMNELMAMNGMVRNNNQPRPFQEPWASPMSQTTSMFQNNNNNIRGSL